MNKPASAGPKCSWGFQSGGAIFGAFFIEYVPNYADQLSVQFGESAKALPGAIYGLLLIAMMAAAPSGVIGLIRKIAALLFGAARA